MAKINGYNKNNSEDDIPVNESRFSVSSKFFNRVLNTLHVLGIIIASVFIIIPAMLLLVGVFFPEESFSYAVLDRLYNNINSLVGLVSLVVGVCSILYSYFANEKMEIHSLEQEAFLQKLDGELKKHTRMLRKINKNYDKSLNVSKFSIHKSTDDELPT
ncbi:MAG: hypothetical protein K2P14_08220 [Anaeroplasmataceae bacterium]|nr:hypothetical protein [Anaeroplasmataceae bacterium]